MGPLQTEKAYDAQGNPGAWVALDPGAEPVFVARHQWIGVDLDGTLARDDGEGHFLPPYPLGEPIPEMIAMVKSLLEAGVTVKIFSARACESASIPIIQAWAERHGLGRLEVTNQKDYDLIRYYDDRAIQMLPNQGRPVSCLADKSPVEASARSGARGQLSPPSSVCSDAVFPGSRGRCRA
ncbi:MAG TPA: hypothetical protein PKI20_05485 [Verrucomicrobiota bacterium]|jgi:hypothetical protein|nr:hypothetical protein [Verrucomicrobiota bacterium]HQL77337.1 hypothetical protein [Verrucomicrobiota bacterium]